MTGGAIHNLFSRAIDALFVIYAVNTLGLGPAEIGITIAVGGPGALLGSLLVGWLGRRVGVGRSIARLQVATGLARLLIPLAGPGAGALVLLGLSNFLMGLIRTAFNVTQVSLRVAMTEERLHGRVNATIRFVMWGVTPLGALAGGWLAASFGVRETLVVASIGTLFAFVPFTVRELRAIRSMPLPAGG
jgi:predicted MFS family arabinose efflux permease